ncbi:MAG: phospho-sugar mutase [Spirochaetes bacterium]|nr:phospho-sugar mutase [Spirochaetota bacterium]
MTDLEKLNLSDELKNKIKEWTDKGYDEQTRKEITDLIAKNDEKELTDRFYKDMEFGTGGLRGVIGAGTNRMNKYNVWKATQGLANYLKEQFTDNISVAIAYDSRNFSESFSLETALVFAGNNIKVHLFESLRPTPMLSFTVRHLKVNAGIVITASHNPPEYNGYKVYWQDGGQIVPPHDKSIIEHVKKVTAINSIKHISREEAEKNGLLQIIGKEVDKAYYEKVRALSINPEIIEKVADDIKIVFTPIHGSGNIPVRTALANAGFKNVFIVKEQEKPDGNFPTVKSPNPEEAATLEYGLKLCKEKDADLLLATDPDSDRVGAAVKNENGDFELLNGNQIASLLTHYILSQLKEKNRLPENGLIIKTIVTTDLITNIADDFHIPTEEVLTGFKYIGERIKIYEDLKNEGKPSKQYIFGGEESYGMLAGDFVRDKDAVISANFIAEMAAYLKFNNKSILQYLDEIYSQYGYYKEILKSITMKGVDGLDKIKKIMETFRNDPPNTINDMKIMKIADLQKGILYDVTSKKEEKKYNLPSSDVLILFLENNFKITMRPSGTEPKIKFYIVGSEKDASNLEETKKRVNTGIDSTTEKFLELVHQI